MGNRNQRRQWIIDAPFQLTFMLRFALVVILSSFFIGVIVFFLTRNSTTVAIENTKIFAKPTSDFILPALCLTVVIVAAIAAAIVLAMTLLISHRIAGPIFRLKREVDLLKKGQLRRNFTVRDKDQLKDLARCLQEMSDVLYGHHSRLKRSCEALENLLQTGDWSGHASDREKIRKILEDIRDNTDYFKV